MYRIIIDAMGGDYAPDEIITGVLQACEADEDVFCLLVGDESKILPLLSGASLSTDRYDLFHTTEFITMDDPPREAIEYKKEASINIAAQLIAQNKGQALVSAGNTGATILAASRFIPRMPGIERAALAAVFPAVKHTPEDPGKTVMLDVGATLHCTPNQLISFAIMGMHYAREVLGIPDPRVGLLNIGEEDTKGHDVLVETHTRLRELPEIHFIGNVEGKDIMRGIADVIVTEGFVGNIVLKALEGLAELAFEMGKRAWQKNVLSKMGIAMLSPLLKKVKQRVDYTEYGGAPILGFQQLVIKAHGRSNAKAVKNAILLAKKSLEHRMVPLIQNSIRDYYLRLLEKA